MATWEVTVTIKLVPGKETFTPVLNSLERLHQYGYSTTIANPPPAGKITAPMDRDYRFIVSRDGASEKDAIAAVHDALDNVGVYVHKARTFAKAIEEKKDAIASIPGNAARAANDAVSGVGTKVAFAGAAGIIFALATIGVGLFLYLKLAPKGGGSGAS